MTGRRLAALTILFFGGLAIGTSARAAEHVTFLLPTVKELPSFAPWVLADELGYYKQEGIEIEFIASKGGVDAAKQIGAGNGDMSEGIGDTAMIVRANGVPVKTVALMGSGGLMQLSIRQDAGIKSLKDLKGKAIGSVSYQDSTFYALLGVLASQGLKRDDVNAQSVGQAGITQLMVTGDLQACSCIPEQFLTIEKAGVKLDIYRAADYFPSMAQATLASDKMIATRPQVVRGVVKAALRMMVEIRDNPIEMAKVYVQHMPTHNGEEAFLGQVFTEYSKRVYGSPQDRLGATDPVKLGKLQDFYVAQDVLQNRMKLEDLYSNDFLPN